MTGFVVDDVAEAATVQRLGEIDRAEVRAAFERRFTTERMARDYLAIYRRLAEPIVRAPTMRRFSRMMTLRAAD